MQGEACGAVKYLVHSSLGSRHALNSDCVLYYDTKCDNQLTSNVSKYRSLQESLIALRLLFFILLGKSVKNKFLLTMTAEKQWVNCLVQGKNDRCLPCQLRDSI
jgi:hypothetical protein